MFCDRIRNAGMTSEKPHVHRTLQCSTLSEPSSVPANWWGKGNRHGTLEALLIRSIRLAQYMGRAYVAFA